MTLAALHRGMKIIRVVAGRQTDLTSQPTPFIQIAEEKRQYESLMFYGLSALATDSERNATPACHVSSVLLNVRDHSPKQQLSKLEAVFFCFFSIFSDFTSYSSFSAACDHFVLSTLTWGLLNLTFLPYFHNSSFGFWTCSIS